MINKITSCIFLCFFSLSLFAQQPAKLEKFSENPEAFMKELEGFMGASKNQTLIDEYNDFEKAIKKAVIKPEEMPRIIATANSMYALRMNASSQFLSYLKCLQAVKMAEKGEEKLVELLNVMDGLLADVSKGQDLALKNFLDFATTLYEKNVIFTDNYFNWTASSAKTKMEYADKKPVIHYEKTNLIANRKIDSIQVLDVQGDLFPSINIFKGKNGKVVWRKTNGDVIEATLDTFTIDLRKSGFVASNVKLSYPLFFKTTTLLGKLEDKLVIENKAVEGSYPRFESYEKRIDIKDIGGGADYRGSFKLQGSSVYGYGSKEEGKAQIQIYNDKKAKVYQGYSDLFIIRKGDRIVGEKVQSTLYFDKDSITHPSVGFRYDIQPKELTLERGNNAGDRNPFSNSFHKVNINSDKVSWLINKDTIQINEKKALASAADLKVTFESLKFYDEVDYRKLQGIGSSNPLATLQTVSQSNGRELDAEMLAKEINPKFDEKTCQSLYFELVSKGFIDYDIENHKIYVKDKVFHYADASQKKSDFDNIEIESEFDKSNAIMDLKDPKKGMLIQGVKSLELSPRQRVALKPTGNKLTLRENRNLLFDGKMFAGLGVFQGKGYDFDYDKFQVVMDSIRFFDLFVPNPEQTDKSGNPKPMVLASRIEYLTGILLVDAPSNKSGRENIPIFPSLQTKGPSYVYYDLLENNGGIYKRDSFFFKLDPFSFNSLDKFTKTDVKFKGQLISANIFPDLKETIVVQPDESLGFVNQSPPEGYPVYLNKGNYKGGLSLNNKGLTGKGTLAYLGSETQSEDLLFKPKQLTGTSKKFFLKEDRDSKVKTPQIKGKDVSINWLPYRDSLYVNSKDAPFDIFKEGIHTLKGQIILTPDGAKGNGLFDWPKGSVISTLMSFGPGEVKADTMNLQIRAIGANDLAFDTRNVGGSIDFDKQYGKFKANSEELSTTMPYNQYQTSMNEFDWDLKNETITFKADKDKMALFRSIHPDQDSLKFLGKTAFYDLKSSELKIGGVPYINTGGAIIYLQDTTNVFIRPGGNMDTLYDAKIVCDTINKYHVINRATVHVEGKKLYHAKGYYEYKIGDKVQEILFSNILGSRVGKGQSSEKNVVTNATGEVASSDSFFIDKKTQFKGVIALAAANKELTFDGFARLEVPLLSNRHYFSIRGEGDKKDLALRFDVPKNEDGEPIRNGIFLSKEVGIAYPCIMAPTFFRVDRPVLEAKGVFKYNPKTEEYVFGDTSKILNATKKGNKLVFNTLNGNLNGEGKFNIGSGLKYCTIDAAGILKAKMDTIQVDSLGSPLPAEFNITTKIMAGIETYIPEKLIQIMTADIQATADGQFVDYVKEGVFYEKALAEFIPNEQDLLQAITYSRERSLDIPKKYNPYALLFSDLQMKWNNEYQSFVTTNEKIGLGSIAGVPINRMVTGHVEFRMPANGDDRFYVYLKTGGENFYFFGYQQGILSIASSNENFMTTLDKMKKGELSKKQKDGELYEVQGVNEGTAQMFVRRIKDAFAPKVAPPAEDKKE